MAHDNGDAFDRELASLKETIGLTNPLTFGHKSDWKTTPVVARETTQLEGAFAKTLPNSFVLTEPRGSIKSFQVAAQAAKAPVQPLHPPSKTNVKENGNTSKNKTPLSPEDDASALTLQRRELPVSTTLVKRVPMAKRSHMDGILHGIPRAKTPPKSTQQDAMEYSGEMQNMNDTKDTIFHRKRDAYSEYVEARARFSKMHSVN